MVMSFAKSYVKIHVPLFILFYRLKVSNRIKKSKNLIKKQRCQQREKAKTIRRKR